MFCIVVKKLEINIVTSWNMKLQITVLKLIILELKNAKKHFWLSRMKIIF